MKMCSVCFHDPCSAACPNAPEALPEKKCISCGDGIFFGEKYYDSENGPICKGCLMEISGLELLELAGEKLLEENE